MKDIIIIGGGPGDASYILPAARQAVSQCGLIIGDKRLLEIFGLEADGKYIFEMGRMVDRLRWLKEQPDSLRVGILVSGDPLMYSMLRLVQRTFPEAKIHIVPGIGSIQVFAARLGESLEEAKIISAHGRNMTGGMLAAAVRENSKLFILCDHERTPDWMAGQLIDAGLTSVHMAVGSRISYPDEILLSGSPQDVLCGKGYPPLSLVMVKNLAAVPVSSGFFRDGAFLRNRTPMTREEIRWIAVGKLGLSANSVVWDVGAGTGSVSVECAGRCPSGKVIAIEKNPRALEVLRQNQAYLAPVNMEIIEGAAPAAFKGLERPSHVFIGGSGGALAEILKEICRYGAGIRIVIACVTLETMMEAYKLSGSMEGLRRQEAVTIRIETDRPVGNYHLMEGGHPVTLIIAETCSGQEGLEACQ